MSQASHSPGRRLESHLSSNSPLLKVRLKDNRRCRRVFQHSELTLCQQHRKVSLTGERKGVREERWDEPHLRRGL